MDVFISYARDDSRHANRLYNDLLSLHGVTPWLDSKKLQPGVRWKLAVMLALKKSDLFIVLLSTHSVSKTGFVQKEIREALEKLDNFPPDQIYLIPARIEECQPKHPELDELQWVDLFPDWGAGFRQICDLIQTQLTSAPPISPFLNDSNIMETAIETISSQEVFVHRLKERGELRGCDAMEIELSGAMLARKDLSGANFVRCILTDCDFRNCNLRAANFEGAVFRNCRLADADLWGVNFWGADIRGIVDFAKARLDHSNFFMTRQTIPQERIVLRGPTSLFLQNYAEFIDYFREKAGIDQVGMARTFIWLNHRYFLRILGVRNDVDHVAKLQRLQEQTNQYVKRFETDGSARIG